MRKVMTLDDLREWSESLGIERGHPILELSLGELSALCKRFPEIEPRVRAEWIKYMRQWEEVTGGWGYAE